MKKWLLTKNNQLIDLNYFNIFFLEKRGSYVLVFANNKDESFTIAEFKTPLEAQEYLIEIHKALASPNE